MEIADSYTLHASREQVWNALLDPATLKRSVPGCELLEQTGDNAYAMRLNVRVAGDQGGVQWHAACAGCAKAGNVSHGD